MRSASSILKTIGLLLFALAIIAVISCNWKYFTPFIQVAISFTPFLLAIAFSVFVITNTKSPALNEIAAVLTFAGIVFLITTLIDLCHIQANEQDIISLNLALALPLMYVFDSYFLFSLIAFLLPALRPDFMFGYTKPLESGFDFYRNFAFITIMFPFLWAKLKNKDFSGALLQILSLPYLLFIIMTFAVNPDVSWLIAFALAGFILILSFNEVRRGVSILKSPLCFIVYYIVAFSMAFATQGDMPGIGVEQSTFATIVPAVFMIVLLAVSIYMAFKNFREDKKASFISDLILLLYQVSLLNIYFSNSGQSRLINNFLLLAVAFSLINEGRTIKRPFIYFRGIIIFLIYFYVYFLTNNLLQRGNSQLLMIAVASIFIILSYFLYKRIKSPEEELSGDVIEIKVAES